MGAIMNFYYMYPYVPGYIDYKYWKWLHFLSLSKTLQIYMFNAHSVRDYVDLNWLQLYS